MLEIKKNSKRIIIYLISFFVVLILLFFVKKYLSSNNVLANYMLMGTIDYSIEQKENSVVGDNSSNQELFVSSTINNLIVDFNYEFAVDKSIKYKYRYEINSFVVAELDDSSIENKEVFRKKQNLVKTLYNDNFSNSFNVNNRISLNYDFYNNISKEYNKSVDIPIKSKLLVELSIFLQVENQQEKEYKYYISLPLEKNTFSITSNNEKYKGKILNEDDNLIIVSINFLMINLCILFIIFVTLELIKFFKYKKEHYVEFKYRKIMKDYDNIIVPISELPKDNDMVSVKVLYFKSMIDIQKELHLPILCYNDKGFIVYFIINHKLAYIYFLNNDKERI